MDRHIRGVIVAVAASQSSFDDVTDLVDDVTDLVSELLLV